MKNITLVLSLEIPNKFWQTRKLFIPANAAKEATTEMLQLLREFKTDHKNSLLLSLKMAQHYAKYSFNKPTKTTVRYGVI